MSKVNVCLVKPDNYIHCYALFELGELIFFSLKDLGFEATFGLNKIEPRGINILLGCHLLDPKFMKDVPKSTIILNTEQIYTETAWNKNMFSWVKNFEVWDYSERNIEKLNQIGAKKVKFFKIGFQKELSRLQTPKEKDVDVLFYGSINERRKNIIDKLSESGLVVKTLFGIYGKARDEWVERSKLVLNHHFYNSQIFEIVRVFYLLTNSVAVVGEVNDSTYIEARFREGIHAAKYDDLVAGCIDIVNNDTLRSQIQNQALASISKYPQKIFTEEAMQS
jgi:hypothetical protein